MKNTRLVSLEMMKNHGKAVVNNTKNSMTIIDMPYNTYRNKKEALKNSIKVMRETKCDAVKLEGGVKIREIIKYLVKNKIPVMGHLGLLPQSVRGKFKSKGKIKSEKKQLLKDSKILEELGAFAIVLECVETYTSKLITQSIKIPTIGIGSSVFCDGQVLVTDDLLGLNETNIRFVKKFANLKKNINQGLKRFKKEIILKKYPSKKFFRNHP